MEESDNEPGVPSGASIEHFAKLDIRVGRVLEAAPLEGARRPAYRLRIDFGDEIGQKQSSVQITERYRPQDVVGRLVLGVVNLPPRRIAGYRSDVLTLGVYASGGGVVLIAPDGVRGVEPGDRLG